MKKAIVIFLIVSLFSSCSLIEQTTSYRIAVFNQSSTEILVEYETIEGIESTVLHNNIYEAGYNKTIYRSSHEDEREKYTKEEFESIIYSVKLSIVNGNDTIPVSREFAPFENWEYWDHYDDYNMEHDYRIRITDDMLD